MRTVRWSWRNRLSVAVVVAAATAMGGLIGPAANAAPRYGPAQTDWRDAVVASIGDPDLLPGGMNRPGCTPREGTRPVVLLNGAFLNKYATWSKFSPQLASAGFCVFGLDYGGPKDGPFHQVGDLRTSAAEVGEFIDRVRSVTGSDHVDLVGYSEGGMVPFYYLNVLGGTRHVDTVVTVSSPVRGMSGYGVLDALTSVPQAREALRRVLPAAVDGAAGSSYFREVSAHGLTRPGVRYVAVSSLADLVVTPHEARLPAADNVTNVVVQDGCGQDRVFHGSIIYDERALRMVQNALDPSTARPPGCVPVAPLVG
ncbi:esterase/lipase family protein [Gordonia humi]|uniref:Pimeloyl-ACP methyl ester carboxylesterase n=1 Tax=Gordonia humi TaxID=686429 RepID=A0A840F4I5_9ACTN|nr:alpha/beta fold hydrolase [Gordonia humi]MBB4137413.1 pimeloyl-ACP methyl ester carboxylesterase [Gordonia humi]